MTPKHAAQLQSTLSFAICVITGMLAKWAGSSFLVAIGWVILIAILANAMVLLEVWRKQ